MVCLLNNLDYLHFVIFQVLVTKPDFCNEDVRKQLLSTLQDLLLLNIIPIINTNDAVAPPQQFDGEDVPGVCNFQYFAPDFLIVRSGIKKCSGTTA